MHVIKRNGTREPVQFDKVLERIRRASENPTSLSVNYTRLAQLVLADIHDDVHTSQLDELAAGLAVSYITTHPDWAVLASRIIVSNCQRNVPTTFSQAMAASGPALAPHIQQFIRENAAALDAMVNPDNDYLLDYFGFKTLERSYLMHADGKKSAPIVESPQYLWLRVAVGIHATFPDALLRIRETYDLMSTKAFTHATPTLFNAGTPAPQLSSCFLIAMKDDSIEGIYDTLKQCALISKFSGGIGLHFHNIRAAGSHIAGTNGTSNGIVPFLKVFNESAAAVNQGGKRSGSIAVYLEPWHADVMEFVELRRTSSGTEETRARKLFYAMWISDLFMRRVEANQEWSLFCPQDAPGLADAVGDDFVALYERYEATPGLVRKRIPAQKLWISILDTQIETGMPYLVYKDAANLKSNQKNLGTIKSSNLCTEIIEYSSAEETAVCNLASISLPYFLRPDNTIDYDRLHEVVAVIVRNLNRVIDINYYPTVETRRSNMRHRPIGIGVQGLADILARMRLPWESQEAAALNRQLFEHIYYAALTESCRLATEEGAYETFAGSPASQGLLQMDLWTDATTTTTTTTATTAAESTVLDWPTLRARIQEKGLRNSLLMAPMPTASTSQILGNNECIEPFTSNIYVRRTQAGDFTVVNKYLISDLMQRELWTPMLKDQIIAANGSIQALPTIPADLKELYKTVWEIKQRALIDMAAERGRFICQSQSLNLYLQQPTIAKLSSMHFYAWKRGLKTGVYYMHTKTLVDAIKFTVDPSLVTAAATATATATDKDCILCSS